MADPTPDPARESDVPARREHGSGASVARPEPARQEEPRSGFLADLFAPVAGFGVSFKTQFRKVATEEYPEEKRPTAPRYHGRHQLNRHPDGLEKCVGCELCAWACPADAILVEGADNDDTPLAEGGRGRFSPGERYGRVYQINYLRCIFCGLCIEACPTRALTMTNEYEMADHTRADLIFEKHQLLAPLAPGMVPAPHPMVEGTDEADYYRGAVSGPTPAQEAYVRDREAAAEGAARSSGATESLLDPGDGSPRPAGHHATHRTASPATSAAAATSAATNGGDRR